MQKQKIDEKKLGFVLIAILFAYLFSVGVRMYWPVHFADNASMYYNEQLMINTNDGYYYATGAKDILEGNTPDDKQRASAAVNKGLVVLTAYLSKLFSISLEAVILYLPAIISSLIVIPIVLTGRLMGHTFLGFLSALIGSVAWSYYNRTMVGYYDTDMFSVFLQFTIFYTLLHVAYKKDLKGIFIAAFFMFIYPYFYPQGMTLVYAMYIMLVLYLMAEYKHVISTEETDDFKEGTLSLYGSIILLSIPLMLMVPFSFRIILFMLAAGALIKIKTQEKYLFYAAIVFFISFLIFGNVFSVILAKLMIYADRGVTKEGLHFYQVVQTVREAGAIPMSTIANRISGSGIGLALSLIGYVLLVMRHKPFLIALPLIGVGLFAYIGGLRFTVYAVPVAALSVVYLFWVIGDYFKEKKLKYLFAIVATALMLYPNIKHIIGYKVPTVLNVSEVNDLVKLDSIAQDKDYTLAWWDYGYPIWFYSNTNTLIDGGKHQNDNFIISKIMQTTSPELAANLSRLAVETYVDSNYSVVTDTLFKNEQKDQLDPNLFLAELEDENYKLPAKTRDIYLYLPYRMLNIFPTVSIFGNIDLTTGKQIRNMAFYPTRARANDNGTIVLANGVVFDAKKGLLHIGKETKDVKYFIVTQNTNEGKINLQSQLYQPDGEYAVVYMKSYGQFVVMGMQTFKSVYVQMFMLGKYDKRFFELVVSSPYSRIYKLKKY